MADAVGQRLAERAKEAGVETAVFDRGGYRYHGNVKALADESYTDFVEAFRDMALTRMFPVLFGAGDPLFSPEDAEPYWRAQLCGCRFEVVAGGGRFLHVTHVERIVAALGQARQVGTI